MDADNPKPGYPTDRRALLGLSFAAAAAALAAARPVAAEDLKAHVDVRTTLRGREG